MWPWGHAAVGYLLYASYCQVRDDLPPAGPAAIAVAVGAQVPDLVDKTASWYLFVLPTGRSLAHSLVVAVPVVLAIGWYARRRGHPRLGLAFGLGWIAHSLADALVPFVTGEWQYLTFLAWPVLPSPDYQGEPGIIPHLMALEPTLFFLFELAVTALALALWARHGYPGVGTLRSWTRSALS